MPNTPLLQQKLACYTYATTATRVRGLWAAERDRRRPYRNTGQQEKKRYNSGSARPMLGRVLLNLTLQRTRGQHPTRVQVRSTSDIIALLL